MIELDFEYTRQDVVRAWRAHYREKLRLPLDLLAIAALLGLGIRDLRANGTGFASIVPLALASLLAAVLVLALLVIPGQVWRRTPKLRQRYRLCFSKDGVTFQTEGIDSRLEWRLYQRASADRESYRLYYGPDQFSIIPRRVVPDPRAFEDLLRARVRTLKLR